MAKGGLSSNIVERKRRSNVTNACYSWSRRRWTALAVTGSAFLGLVGIGAGAYLGYDWFKYRVKNGMILTLLSI